MECPHLGRLVSQAWKRDKQYLLSRWEFRGLRHVRRRPLDREKRRDRSSQASLGRIQTRRTNVVAERRNDPIYARRQALGDQFEWIEPSSIAPQLASFCRAVLWSLDP